MANDLDFEEGMLWLPAHVLEEACESKETLERRQQQHRHKILHTSGAPFPPHLFPKPDPKLHQRPRYPSHRASGGPGMQAIFIGSSQRSCGTGVFLPQNGSSFNFQQSKKPACSPVLLPSRVVQALNLNVHALMNNNRNQGTSKGGIRDWLCNKNGSNDDVFDGASDTEWCASSLQARSHPSPSPAEIFLPEEWSY